MNLFELETTLLVILSDRNCRGSFDPTFPYKIHEATKVHTVIPASGDLNSNRASLSNVCPSRYGYDFGSFTSAELMEDETVEKRFIQFSQHSKQAKVTICFRTLRNEMHSRSNCNQVSMRLTSPVSLGKFA